MARQCCPQEEPRSGTEEVDQPDDAGPRPAEATHHPAIGAALPVDAELLPPDRPCRRGLLVPDDGARHIAGRPTGDTHAPAEIEVLGRHPQVGDKPSVYLPRGTS